MLKHLIAAIDFPLECDKYCAELIQLKPIIGLEKLTLVHVLGGDYPHIPAVTHQDEHLKTLQNYAAFINQELNLASIECRVEVGLVADQINQVANETQADGVVALFQNHSKLRDFLLGNTALELAQQTQHPLLLLTQQPDPASGTLMLATDGSVQANAAQNLFNQLKPHAKYAMIIQVVDSIPSTMNDGRIRLEGEPVEQILAACHQHQVDLLIIGQSGEGHVKEWLLGSTAESLCRQAKRPVLIVPAHQIINKV